MYISKPIFTAVISLCLSVLGAAAIAYNDVQSLKVEVKNYKEHQLEIKEDLREIRKDIKKLLSKGG
jgi:hypothetical protein